SEGEVATIGNTAASKIALPSAASQEKEQYGRIVEDSGQWSLESYCAELFTLNHAEEPLPRGGKKDLQDGDLISCKGYQLMFSNFSPWKSESFAETEPQSMEPLGCLETLVSDHLIASQTADLLDDP
ncbi:hypothetical protein CWC18_21070, partial [Pseudoalteromonas aurantia]|uniref:hypothetical protein n=1 Tax=Pseudoalteromonas aurantia TaxID=43654 RepID=UPI00127BCC52